MRSLLHALALGLVGAALVHLAVILMLPGFQAADRWARLAALLPEYRPAAAGSPQAPAVASTDPFFGTAVCRIDLGDGPARVAAEGRVAAWFVSVASPEGRNLASVNDRMVESGKLDLLVLTHAQQSAKQQPEAPAAQPFRLEAQGAQALVALRIFTPDASWRDATRAMLESFSCLPEKG